MGFKQQTKNVEIGSWLKRSGLLLLAALMVASLTCVPLAAIAPQNAYASSNGMLVVAIDPGHGGGESGAYGNGVAEEQANWDIAAACIEELSTYRGVKVVRTHDNSHITDREDRINAAVSQGADVVVSIHCNSAGASANGAEVWVPNGAAYLYDKCHVVGYNLGSKILDKICALGIARRGVYTRDCTDGEQYPSPGGTCDWYGINYWARWKGIPGIIVEHAFVSNSSDAAKLADSNFRKRLGQADATAIAEYYGLRKAKAIDTTANTGVVSTPATSGAIFDNVSTGLRAQVQHLKAYGSTASLKNTCVDPRFNLVSRGSATTVTALSGKWASDKGYGAAIKDMINTMMGLSKSDYNIMDASLAGSKSASVQKMVAYYGKSGKTYPSAMYSGKGAASITDFCNIVYDEAIAEGVCPEVVFCQSMKETGWLAFGGQVIPEQCNFAGIGAVDSDKSVMAKLNLSGVPTDINTVYVDGVAQTLTRNGSTGAVKLPREGSHSISMYKQNTSSSDPHQMYPTESYTWIATRNGSNYEVTRYNAMDNLLRYGGSSIRITGNQGIRLITGLDQDVKDSVIATGVKGYKLVETGTLLAWSRNVNNGGLTMDTSGVSRGKAFVSGSKNPVFNVSNGVEQYTNVLVGFKLDQCKEDLTMRSYSILKNASGDQIIVYGGPVQRSIGYIAQQNANAFPAGSSSYNFVHNIIDACK